MTTKLISLCVVVGIAIGSAACKSGNPQLRQDITAAVQSTQPTLNECYQLAMARNRKTAGGFFTVDAVVEGTTGQFKDVVVRRDEVQDPAVRQCVVFAVRALKLAKPGGGANTQVSFAFRFTPQNAPGK